MEDHPVALAMTTLRRLRDERWWSEPSAMVGHVIAELRGFEVCLASRRPRDHWHRLRWLWDQARFFDETTGGTLRDFLRWAELEAADDRRTGGVGPPDPDDDAVRVMTIHGAKGLEFPVVVLAGLERDPTAGHRLPAVLWDDDGTPELSAGVDFRTAGYELIAARERHLDALEQDRLLYVGMTRARDHLFVCLHHKQTNTATPAARLTELCERHRELWRRPPLTVGQSPEAEHPPEAEQPPEAEEWRMYVRDFEARRVKLLSAARRAPVTTATAVAAALSGSGRAPRSGDEPVESSGGGPGAAEDAPFADWEAARLGVPSQDEEVALRIGRAVHGALAVIDLETGTDEAGHAAEIVARGRATAFGVSAHAGTVAAMVDTARRAPTVAAGATRRHWRELYVAAPVGRDGVLEGFVDLVIEEPDGLVVVDYKTDRIDGPGGATATGSHYLPQLASYAECLEAATGRAVHRCVLVFVAGGEPIEVSYDGDTLAAARARVLVAASDLVAAR
jgi:ATP-dependent exoDNAse (exonuclease V) beta subunit